MNLLLWPVAGSDVEARTSSCCLLENFRSQKPVGNDFGHGCTSQRFAVSHDLLDLPWVGFVHVETKAGLDFPVQG